MSILIECPICHNKQGGKNKRCKCGEDLDKAKRSHRVKYWITYRLPGGKQRREAVGYSIEEAKAAEGKRRSQKRENRIFDMLPESKMTYEELAEWYLDLKSVKKLASWDRVKLALNNFNKVFGEMKVVNTKPIGLENYQCARTEQGLSPATIDMEIKIAQTAVTKAFDNDMIDGRALKAFRKVKRKLKKGSNARKRILTSDEYLRLIDNALPHLRPILITAYNTGMRAGELRLLKWSYIDRKEGFIRLPAKVTKEKRAKSIPINHHVARILDSITHALLHDFVFTYRGRCISHKGGLKKSFATSCRKANIPCGRKVENGFIFHDIRRTVKTNMLNAGVDKVHRDVILGHSIEGMDVHYLAPSEDTLRDAMVRYTEWLDCELDSASVDQAVDHTQKRLNHS